VGDQLNKLIEQFRQMPRAMRWASYFIAFLVAFFVWDASFGNMMRTWQSDISNIEQQIEKARQTRQVKRQLQSPKLTNAVLAFGEVSEPPRSDEGRTALHRAVNDVLTEHRYRNDDFNLGGGGSLPDQLARRILERGELEIITGELKFDASPEDTIAIISDLEKHPDIDAIKEVSLKKIDGRELKVRLVVLMWVKER
jgi:hypothetical protein